MNRRCSFSKPTPTPLNGLAMKPGKTKRKVIEGNADTIMRQTTRQKPAAYLQCGGGGETKKALWQDKLPSKPSRILSAWRKGDETEKGELKENTGAKPRKPKSIPPRRLPSWRGSETRRQKPTRNGKVVQPTVPRGGESA